MKLHKDPLYYKIRLKSNLFFKDQNILSTATDYTWLYQIIEQVSYNRWLVSLDVIAEEQSPQVALQNTNDFLKMTNKALEGLRLLLDEYGCIVEVENKKEVLEKWNALKEVYCARKSVISDEEHAFLKKCDVDFRDLKSTLINSLHYFIFFAQVYEVHPDNTVGRNLTFPSVVNSGAILYNYVKQKIAFSEGMWVIKQYCRHRDYGNINLKKKYKKELMKFLTAPFEYHFHYDVCSMYNPKSCLLENVKATIVEQASAEYRYNMDMEISLMTKEEVL